MVQVPKPQIDTATIEEIIVTAQRRAESLQDVPVTVTSQSAQSLEDAAVRNLEELKTLVSGYQGPGDNAAQSPHIRGVGSTAIQPGSESVVALYVDDIYIGTPSPALITLNNVDRVDVLKGPQGTLFGRNTTAGVVQVTTRSPSETTWSGEVTAGYANYEVFNGTFYAGGPISEAISSDLAVQARTQGEGWGTNLFTGKDVYKTNLDLGIRSKSIIRLAPETKVELSADYELNKTRGMNVLTPLEGSRSILGYVSQATGWDADSNLSEAGRTEAWGVNGKVRHDFGFAEFVSITAYRRTSYTTTDSDVDGTPAALLGNFRDAKNKQFTQELQLLSPADAPFTWTAGLFYYRSDDDALYLTTLSPLIFRGLTRQTTAASIETESFAAYAQGTVRLSDRTNLTLGGRYTDENAKLDAQVDTFAGPVSRPGTPISDETSDNSPTWRISLDHHFTPDVMAYASYNRGQKSGGFNIANPATPPYLPEKLNAYEVGFRSEFWDRRLTLNTSAFYYDYSDVQVLGFVGTAIQLFNGAGAELYGVDVDFHARLSNRFTVSGALEYLHSEFTSFPNATISTPRPTGGFTQVSGSATGNELPQAPHFTGSITGTYRLPIDSGDWRASATYYYNDGFFFEADNRVRQPNYSLLSTSLTYTQGDMSVRLWGNNLTNEQVMNTVLTSQLNSVRKLNAPRAYGVTLEYRY
ncbi:TonB-dependent receptor [Sphingomonas sp. LaA6.9]|uniref:TonB-dependent receptor n=1 Tax=Sphingomonas sp. LaA6.9 TaxID=2919914 RepID=UPI001F4FF584|nr:TonB-dependent receptor [Sphingomonas sp. LaA6.9]MCJ8157395.1 TonB-dependent receptor [Sphingomonas sp. LaA6.9]